MTQRGSRLLRLSICLYWVLLALWLAHLILQELDRKTITDNLSFTPTSLLKEATEWSKPLIVDIKILEEGLDCDEPAFTRSEGGSKKYEAKLVGDGQQAEVTNASQNQTSTADPDETQEESAPQNQTNATDPEETQRESAPQNKTDSSNAGALQDGNAEQNQTSSSDLGITVTADQEDPALIDSVTERINELKQAQEAISIEIQNSDIKSDLADQIEALQNVTAQISEQLQQITALQTSNETDQEEFAKEQTVNVTATKPIKASNFKDNTTICLTRSDQSSSYRKFVTVDLSTQSCPSGYEPCSKLTDPANTLCVQPGTQNQNCPITDIKVILKSQIMEQLSSEESEIYEQADFSGDDDDLDWALFYSREYNGLPLVSFVLEQQKPCFSQGKRRGDPKRDILDIGVTQYKKGCEDKYSGLVNERYRSVSKGLTFAEDEWFEDAGIWAAYETLPGKEIEVERLKERKSETQLQLWAKRVPAYRLECRSGISDVETFASLIKTELDQQKDARQGLIKAIDEENHWLDNNYVPLFWCIFGLSIPVIILQFTCVTCLCQIKNRRHSDEERQKILSYNSAVEFIFLTTIVVINLANVILEITTLNQQIEFTSDPYFKREDTILEYAQCSDQYLELAVDKNLKSAFVAPPVAEFGFKAILSIVIGFLMLPIWMTLSCIYNRLVWEQWALIDQDFPPPGRANQIQNAVQQDALPRAPEALPTMPEEPQKPDVSDNPAVDTLRKRIAAIEAVQVARDEESKEIIEDGYNTRNPDFSASASASVSPEKQSEIRVADGSEAKILDPQSIEVMMKEPQD